jgi:hypothetical protein
MEIKIYIWKYNNILLYRKKKKNKKTNTYLIFIYKRDLIYTFNIIIYYYIEK